MSTLFYRLGLSAYTLGIRFAAFAGLSKAQQWTQGRRHIFRALQQAFAYNQAPVLWMHCASLGEFEQGRPLLEALKQKHPNYKILLTFFSPSGYEIRKNYAHADWVFYLPPDSKKNAQQFLQIVQPQLAIFVKYEFWYYYLTQLKDQQIPTYLIAAIFRSNQPFFKWYGQLFRTMLHAFKHIFVQNEASLKLLHQVDYKNITIAGDPRLDRVLAIKAQAKRFPIINQFCTQNNILVGGSTWPADETILAEFAQMHPNYKLILAPHQIDEPHILQIEQTFQNSTTLRYSQQPDEAALAQAQVLIIDNIGMLSSLYSYGNMAYIGGGFGAGIHNTLEAVVFHIPICFGGNYHKFNEAKELLKIGVAFEVQSVTDVSNIAQQIQKEEAATAIAKKAQDYIQHHKGATDIILKHLKSL